MTEKGKSHLATLLIRRAPLRIPFSSKATRRISARILTRPGGMVDTAELAKTLFYFKLRLTLTLISPTEERVLPILQTSSVLELRAHYILDSLNVLSKALFKHGPQTSASLIGAMPRPTHKRLAQIKCASLHNNFAGLLPMQTSIEHRG